MMPNAIIARWGCIEVEPQYSIRYKWLLLFLLQGTLGGGLFGLLL